MSFEVATDPEWEVVRAKVYSAENLSLEEKAAAYKQLSKHDLTLVEQLLDGRSQQDLTDVLRKQLPGECFCCVAAVAAQRQPSKATYPM